jgi:hypothetical protein
VTPPRVPSAARHVAREWQRLARTGPAPGRFDPAGLDGLPEPARRWLCHAIAPGTPLWQSAELSMTGRIKLRSWRPFTARQVLCPPAGFIWAARARVAGLPVTGYDRLCSGTAELRWRVLGLVPVLSAGGPDVARSAAGRLAGEGVLVPTSCLHAAWTAGDDPDRATLTWTIDGSPESAELHVGHDGRLLAVTMDRWGNPDGASFARHRFGVTVDEETEFGGVTIPSVLRAGWWWGTDRADEGEFFRARITAATFR